MRVFFSNWKMAVSVAAAGMTLPFALGCAVAHGIYHQFGSEPGTVQVAYGTFVRLCWLQAQQRAFANLICLVAIRRSCYGYHSNSQHIFIERTICADPHLGLSSALPYPDRTKTAVYAGWPHHPGCGCW
jgi:hypothetical protein